MSFDASATALREFGSAQLGHRSRTERAVRIASALLQQPDAPLLKIFADPQEYRRACSFMDNPRTLPSALLSGHRAAMRDRIRDGDVRTVLAILDQSEVDLTGKQVRGVGSIGDGHGQGFSFQTTLLVAVEPHVSLLGVADQLTWLSPPPGRRRVDIPSNQLRKDPLRESRFWLEAMARVHAEFSHPLVHLIYVTDRGGDIFEIFELALAQSCGFIVRLTHERCASVEREGEPRREGGLKTLGRSAPVVGRKRVQVRASKEHLEHEADVEIHATRVRVEPPTTRAPRGEAIELNVVVAREVNAPEGSEPLDWCLLTTEPIETEEQVLRIVEWYEHRWLVEELHKGIKTGCRLEKRQFEQVESFYVFLAFASVVAWQLLRLREAARREPEQPAEQVLSTTQLEVLRQLRPKLPKRVDARTALRAVAGIGGFLGRKSDGEPGWQVLWRGWRDLLLMEVGYRLARGLGPPPDQVGFDSES